MKEKEPQIVTQRLKEEITNLRRTTNRLIVLGGSTFAASIAFEAIFTAAHPETILISIFGVVSGSAMVGAGIAKRSQV